MRAVFNFHAISSFFICTYTQHCYIFLLLWSLLLPFIAFDVVVSTKLLHAFSSAKKFFILVSFHDIFFFFYISAFTFTIRLVAHSRVFVKRKVNQKRKYSLKFSIFFFASFIRVPLHIKWVMGFRGNNFWCTNKKKSLTHQTIYKHKRNAKKNLKINWIRFTANEPSFLDSVYATACVTSLHKH